MEIQGVLRILFCLIGAGFLVEAKMLAELISIETESTNPEKFNLKLKQKKISSNVYGVSGNLSLNFDIRETMIASALIYYSVLANQQWNLTPYQVPPTKFDEFMNGIYVKLIQGTTQHCSNMIVVKEGEKWVPPYPKGLYTLDKCIVDGASVPDQLHAGFYKIVFQLVAGKTEKYGATVVVRTYKGA